MMKILLMILSLTFFTSTVAQASERPGPANSKKVCHVVKKKQQCKIIKVHKKLTGIKVPKK